MIDKNRSEREALGGDQAFGGDLSMPIKDAFEMLITIFHGDGTQLVKDPADFHTIIRMGVTSIPGRNLQAIGLRAVLMEVGRVVMAITQDETDFGRNFARTVRVQAHASRDVAGVSAAAMGNQTAATTQTMCSFQP